MINLTCASFLKVNLVSVFPLVSHEPQTLHCGVRTLSRNRATENKSGFVCPAVAFCCSRFLSGRALKKKCGHHTEKKMDPEKDSLTIHVSIIHIIDLQRTKNKFEQRHLGWVPTSKRLNALFTGRPVSNTSSSCSSHPTLRGFHILDAFYSRQNLKAWLHSIQQPLIRQPLGSRGATAFTQSREIPRVESCV